MRFRELALLIQALLSSGGMMVYTLTVLMVLLFIFACAGCQLVGGISSDPGLDPGVAELVEQHFGTLTLSMLTMVQFVCLDGIADVYWIIVIERPELSVYFVAVTLVIGIVVMNLVTGVMVNTAMEHAMENKAVAAEHMKRKKAKVVHELRDLFHRLDKDLEGTLTLDELTSLSPANKANLVEVMQSFEPEDIFHSLEVEGNDTIAIDEFIDGVWSIVAAGTSPDMKRMQKQVESLHANIHDSLRGQTRIVRLIDDLRRECLTRGHSGSLRQHQGDIGKRLVADSGASGASGFSGGGRSTRHQSSRDYDSIGRPTRHLMGLDDDGEYEHGSDGLGNVRSTSNDVLLERMIASMKRTSAVFQDPLPASEDGSGSSTASTSVDHDF